MLFLNFITIVYIVSAFSGFSGLPHGPPQSPHIVAVLKLVFVLLDKACKFAVNAKHKVIANNFFIINLFVQLSFGVKF